MINEGHLKQFIPNLSSNLVFISERKVLYLGFFTLLIYLLLFYFESGEKVSKFGHCTELALAKS